MISDILVTGGVVVAVLLLEHRLATASAVAATKVPKLGDNELPHLRRLADWHLAKESPVKISRTGSWISWLGLFGCVFLGYLVIQMIHELNILKKQNLDQEHLIIDLALYTAAQADLLCRKDKDTCPPPLPLRAQKKALEGQLQEP